MTRGQELELAAQERRMAELEAAIARAQGEQARWLTELGQRVYCIRDVLTRAEAALADMLPRG